MAMFDEKEGLSTPKVVGICESPCASRLYALTCAQSMEAMEFDH